MSACGREFHLAYMRRKISSFEVKERESRARRRATKSHLCSIGDISGGYASQGRICMCWAGKKFRTVFATCGRTLYC
ncbi:uncharacterized protein TNCV_3814561 [Trichonephila clavipes]|nr:uncharacterized protein TNCV_3814561 [Trichonephila clavipes]